jgi:hypothetical protein
MGDARPAVDARLGYWAWGVNDVKSEAPKVFGNLILAAAELIIA